MNGIRNLKLYNGIVINPQKIILNDNRKSNILLERCFWVKVQNEKLTNCNSIKIQSNEYMCYNFLLNSETLIVTNDKYQTQHCQNFGLLE